MPFLFVCLFFRAPSTAHPFHLDFPSFSSKRPSHHRCLFVRYPTCAVLSAKPVRCTCKSNQTLAFLVLFLIIISLQDLGFSLCMRWKLLQDSGKRKCSPRLSWIWGSNYPLPCSSKFYYELSKIPKSSKNFTVNKHISITQIFPLAFF